MAELIFKQETYEITGTAMEVDRELGCGFLETVYQEALAIEFHSRDISFKPQHEREISFKDHLRNKYYLADFVVFDSILVEIKAIDQPTQREESQ